MKLIVGLGNPGKRFEETRHNTGFMVLDFLREKYELRNWQTNIRAESLYVKTSDQGDYTIMVKPQTFMNDSGKSVKYFVDLYKIKSENIFVVFDDLDIVLGEYKIQKGKGPKDHNGLHSIYEKTGMKDFWHVRIGISNDGTRMMDHGSRISGEDYVLMNFEETEKDTVQEVIKNVGDELREMLQL